MLSRIKNFSLVTVQPLTLSLVCSVNNQNLTFTQQGLHFNLFDDFGSANKDLFFKIGNSGIG